jgi:hypothetical protein
VAVPVPTTPAAGLLGHNSKANTPRVQTEPVEPVIHCPVAEGSKEGKLELTKAIEKDDILAYHWV